MTDSLKMAEANNRARLTGDDDEGKTWAKAIQSGLSRPQPVATDKKVSE